MIYWVDKIYFPVQIDKLILLISPVEKYLQDFLS